MKMDTNIRVRTHRRFRGLYKQMKGLAVGDMHELFFLCACLGYKRGKATKLGRNGDDRFWSGTIEPDEWSCFYAMTLEEHGQDFAAIKDDKEVIARMEEYANAGMEILIDELLGEYLTTHDGEPLLDTASARELPKELLQYVFEQHLTNAEASR